MKKTLFLAVLVCSIFTIGNISIFAQKSSYPKTSRERQVRREILILPYYGVFDAIGYELNGDTVTLNGYTQRPITKKDAEAAVADVLGIKKVVNNIEVLPLSTFDDRIRVNTYRAISNEGSLYRYFLGTNPSIRIIVKNGRVILEGLVSNKGDSNLAYFAARGVPGVLGVQNNLEIEKQRQN